VALEAAVPRPDARARAFPLALPVSLLLGGLVGLSAVVRFILALAHTTPLYFADEYIYSTLAYELASTGRPTIRGDAASFPALLEPLLTSVFWIPGDPELALRLTQGLNALAMSLAAIPVYLLARKLGLGRGFGLVAAAVALVVPDLFYVAFILGEPIAYPLVMWAVYAAVCALDAPTRRNQVAFVALAGLASFARIQFVVLPLAFLGAALIARTGLRRLKLSLGLFAVPALAVGVVGLGYYSGIADFSLDPVEFLHWIATDAMLLAYATGWLVVPGALVGIALARGRVERAFAGFVTLFAGGLFLEAGLYATNADVGPGGRFQERYLFTLIPLLTLAFGVSLRKGGRARSAIALLALGLIGISARVPLSGYTDTHGRQDSPFLIGVARIEEALGTANGSLLIAGVVAVLALVAIGVAYRPRFALPSLLVVVALLGVVSLGAWSLDSRYAQRARDTYLPADARWVDHAELGPVTLLNTPGAPRELALEQLYWNRSIHRVALLRRGERVDAFASPQLRIAADGSLLLEGRPLREALLLNRYAMEGRFRGATLAASSQVFDLWRPLGTPRLSLLVGGRYFDGLLGMQGYVRVWPQSRGTLTFPLSLPKSAPKPIALTFRAGDQVQRVRLTPGGRTTVRFAIPTRGVWTLRWKADGGVYLEDGRPVSVQSQPPILAEAASSVTSCTRVEDTRLDV
jgi:dolichyl-phosphate-mannose-protein mannosyltransferase